MYGIFIYLRLVDFFGKLVGEYISPMDAVGNMREHGWEPEKKLPVLKTENHLNQTSNLLSLGGFLGLSFPGGFASGFFHFFRGGFPGDIGM